MTIFRHEGVEAKPDHTWLGGLRAAIHTSLLHDHPDESDAHLQAAVFESIPVSSALIHASVAGLLVVALKRIDGPRWVKATAGVAGLGAIVLSHHRATVNALEHLYWGADGAEAELRRLLDEDAGRDT